MPDIKLNCPSCKQSLEAPPNMAGQLIDCPTCKGVIEIPFPHQAAAQHTAYIKKKDEFVGIGCLVQGLGLGLCFLFFPIGLIAGLSVIFIGGRMAIKLLCSACGNKLEDKEIKICPVCKAMLRPYELHGMVTKTLSVRRPHR